jgi:hypothetical protein
MENTITLTINKILETQPTAARHGLAFHESTKTDISSQSNEE